MGDFNTQSSNEQCFQFLINSTNSNTRFYDPPNQLGDWANNPTAFANYLTQSTRVNDPGDCGAVGGLNFRYDHILCSGPIIQGTNSITYIPGSYKVIGQDGNHTNLALTDAPANTSVPPTVLNALYYMSNHLPVAIQLAITSPLASTLNNPGGTISSLKIEFNHTVIDHLEIKISAANNKNILAYHAIVYNTNGQLLLTAPIMINKNNSIEISSLPAGLYLLQIVGGGEIAASGRFIKY